MRKNQPLVPQSNIAGSWARGGGGTPSGTIFHLRFLKLCECCSGVKSTAEDTSVRLGLWCDERIVCGCGGVFVSV